MPSFASQRLSGDSEPNTKEFIFRPLVTTKSSHKLVKADKSISYSYRDHLTKSLRDVVSDPSAYGTQEGLLWLPTAGSVIKFFKGMVDGKAWRPKTFTDSIKSRLSV